MTAMTSDSSQAACGRGVLFGPRSECDVLDGLVAQVRAGCSGALVLRGVSPSAPPGIRLYGRRTECQALDRLVADVRAGQSRALILRGEAGAGKSVLLDYLAGRASGTGCRVARVVGVPSEMELAFAGLHQLCAPLLHAQWLDPDSAQALAFAARHLAAAPVAVVLALRQPGGEREPTGLPEPPVGGLADGDAQALRAQVAADPDPSRLIPGADA